MKILGIDLSSKTGWSILTDGKLIEYGTLITQSDNKEWPEGILQWSKQTAQNVFDLIKKHAPDVISIERTNSSSFRASQDFLVWSHGFLLDLCVKEGIMNQIHYIDSSRWRAAVGIKLSKEQKFHNKLAKEASKQKKIFKKDGKRSGKITKKHLAVNLVNEMYGTEFKIKDNDVAESILVAAAYDFLNK